MAGLFYVQTSKVVNPIKIRTGIHTLSRLFVFLLIDHPHFEFPQERQVKHPS